MEDTIKVFKEHKEHILGKVVVGAVGLFALSVAMGSFYTIETGTVGVISTFGSYDKEAKEAGLHFKLPFAQKVYIVDTKMQSANYNSTTAQENFNANNSGIYNLKQITVLDSKNLPISLDITVQFMINKNDAVSVLSNYGENYFDKTIHARIREAVRDTAGAFQAETIALERDKLMVALTEKVKDKLVALPEFQLVNISLRDIELPPLVVQKINEVQQAKQEEQRLSMVELQTIKQQSINKTTAETRLIEVTTAARAEAEKRRIEAEGEALAITVKAKAQADANLLVQKSLSPELIRYNEVNRWSGELPKLLVKNGDPTMMFSVPDEISKK